MKYEGLQTHWMHFNGFIASTLFVHKIKKKFSSYCIPYSYSLFIRAHSETAYLDLSSFYLLFNFLRIQLVLKGTKQWVAFITVGQKQQFYAMVRRNFFASLQLGMESDTNNT